MTVLLEPERLASLYRTDVLDTPPERAFDRLTRLAAAVLDAPLALVNLIDLDRQFSKSCFAPEGWPEEREASVKESFCQYAVALKQPVVIEDARTLEPLRSSPVVTEYGLVSYAGVPLITSEGHGLGTLCVAGFEPRAWTEEEIRTLTDLAEAVTAELELRAEVAYRREAEARLEEAASQLRALSLTDELTGLANRRGFEAVAESLLSQPIHEDEVWGVVVADIDNMKEINDALGHAVGDDALVETARRLRRLLPEARVLARMGGDEFAALLSMPSGDAAEDVETDLQARFDALETGDRPYRILGSIGFTAGAAGQAESRAALLQAADERMYAVKARRKPEATSRHRAAGRRREHDLDLSAAHKLATAFELRRQRNHRN